jgi:outer membrane protein TolC
LPACIGATLAALLAFGNRSARAQEVRAYALEQAVREALAHHPRIRSATADEDAAVARVDESETRELPAVGISAQINRSTGNTPPGAFFLTPGMPPISGAPRGKTLDSGEWQTGAGIWASWDALSLVRQAAAVDVALAGRTESEAATSAQRLEVAYRAADAFLLLVEAQETVRAASASVDRAQVVVTMTKPLVDQSLRPGVDAARAEAELANARTALARAAQARELRRAQLAEAVGDTSLRIEASAGGLAGPIDEAPPGSVSVDRHPDVVQSSSAAARANQERNRVEVEYLPRVDLVAALWVRGSGIYDSPASGLVPDIPNWAAGAVVSWSLLDIPTIRARVRVASAARDAASARRDETVLAVEGQLASATALLEGARDVARQTPTALASARAAEEQALARYKTGLSPVVDVADAERLRTQAEIDDAVARLEVRRALLLLARASGDLTPFLIAAGRGGR